MSENIKTVSDSTALAAAWSISSPQRLPVTGGADYPSVRYSASSVMYNGEMIITHGYFYDHGNHHPAWQSNAWAFNIKQQTWRKIHEGERAGSPSARYCSSAVLFEHGLWMFGGDDGGHKTSVGSARPAPQSRRTHPLAVVPHMLGGPQRILPPPCDPS